MNLKYRRSTRTSHSEEIAIFDMENRDEEGEPIDIGKIDVHYADDQVSGTLLIWSEYALAFSQAHSSDGVTIADLIQEVIDEVTEPVGVAEDYGIEVYYPPRERSEFFSSFDEDEELDEFDEYEDEESPNGKDRDGHFH